MTKQDLLSKVDEQIHAQGAKIKKMYQQADNNLYSLRGARLGAEVEEKELGTLMEIKNWLVNNTQ